MLLRVLGPLEVAGSDGPVALGAAKPRALLAALAINRGSICTADALIDALWGDTPPASAAKLLQVYVSQLRRVLPPGIRIVTGTAGYRLELDASEVDAVRFERQLDEGRAAMRAGNPALAASILGRAISLWRGPAYADVRYEEFSLQEIERLERLRDLAIEDHFDAQLALGRHAEVLGELRGLLVADPTRESIAERAMLAAYRTSGPGEALTIYATVRDALRRELGEDPGSGLASLRDRVERSDPSLAFVPGDVTANPGANLPVPPNDLVGRRRELDELRTLLARPDVRLVSLTGAGGSGKSRLALELARELSLEFANGAVLVELASLTDADLVLPTIASALGIEPGQEALATVVDALADRECLLVLDNVEHLRGAAPSLVYLLANAPRLVLVLTTRIVLHLSGEHVYPVFPLADRDAVALFVERAQAQDPTFELGAGNESAVATICRHLDGLPLPIELAAARVRGLGVRALDARLASRLSVLTGGPRDLPARQQTLRETLAWSVNLLEPRHAEVLAALAVFPGSCPMDGAEEVAGADDNAMIELVDHNLVQAIDAAGARRYRLLETVREYAYELLRERRAEVESALTSWIVHVIDEIIPDSSKPVPPTAYDRLDVDLDNLRDALRHASRDRDPTRELAIASGVWRFWWIRGFLAEGRSICDGILERRGLVPTHEGIRTARAAASLAWSMGDWDRAQTVATAAMGIATRAGDDIERLSIHNTLGVIARSRGDLDVAERQMLQAIELAESLGNLELVNMYRMNIGTVYLDAGRLAEARERFQGNLDYRRPEGLSQEVGLAHLNLGQVELQAGDMAAAEAHFRAAFESLAAVGFKARIANSLQGLAAVEAQTGRAEMAARRLGAAAATIGETGWGVRDSPFEATAIAAAREALGDDAFDRFFREGLADGPNGPAAAVA